MSNTFVPRVGGTLSADIAVHEHEREVQFYSQVLCTGEDPLWREDLMNNAGLPVIGLGERTAEYADLPLQWMPHIQVADVASSVERALELEGSELMHGKDGEGNSQWAVLLDPIGAAFGLIPVVSDEAVPKADDSGSARPGCISWLELTVAGAAQARDFYRQVVGWSVEDVEAGFAVDSYTDFHMTGADGMPMAGVRHARGLNLGLPPIWLIHLPVGDLAESLRRVDDGGGKILQATLGADGECERAVIEDPVGACLVLVPA